MASKCVKSVILLFLIASVMLLTGISQEFLEPLVAVIDASPTWGTVPLLVTFDGSKSYTDPNCEIISYEWDFGDGSPVQQGIMVTHTYAQAGTFIATLTVTDSCWQGELTRTASATVVITVLEPINAVLMATPTTGMAPLLVDFDGTGSTTDGRCYPLSYHWDFGDGVAQAGPPVIQHRYGEVGQFLATLTIWDRCEREAIATALITVMEPRPAPPRIDEVTSSCGAPGSVVVLSGDNFSSEWIGENFVNVGGVKAPILGASKTALAFVVPLEAPEGRVLISIAPEEDLASNAVPFVVDRTCSTPDITLEDEQVGFVINEVILRFKPGVTEAEREAIKEEYGFASFQTIKIGGVEAFTIARLEEERGGIANTVNAAESLSRDPRIDFADLNWLVDALQAPTDPMAPTQDHIFELNLPQGWESFFPGQGKGIILAVIDSGIDPTLIEEVEVATDPTFPKGLSIAPGAEEELKRGRIPIAEDEFGHGTMVGTIAAAQANNGIGGAGVAFNSAVIPIKVFSYKGKTSQGHVGFAMILATKLQADVVNMSIGCFGCFRAVKRRQAKFYDKVLDAIEEAFFREKIFKVPIFVAASGNDGINFVDAPARNDRVIAVGSYNLETQRRSDFSNYGPEVDFVALGDNVFTMKLGGEWGGTGPGTSFSAPQVAGLVALILSTEPELARFGADGVIEKIKNCFSQDVGAPGFDKETGWGLIRIPSPGEVDPKKCLIFPKRD